MRFFDFRSLSYVKTLAASFVLVLVLVLVSTLPAEAGIVNKVDVDSVALLARANTTSTAASTAVSTAPSTTTSSTPAPTGTRLLNKRCSKASQCTTGVCNDLLSPICYATNGRPYICDFNGDRIDRCRQVPLGHSCANTGDCSQGVCNKNTSTCTLVDVGAYCVRDTHCKSPALCDLSRKRCVVPTNQTILPQQPCAINEQCKSGKCEKQRASPRDKYLEYPFEMPYENYEIDRNRCEFYALGQSGCQDYTECQEGFCYNGKCARGEAGDQCILNDNCTKDYTCGLDGKCYLPPATNQLRSNAPTVNAATQCLSGRSRFSYNVRRPIPGDGGKKHDFTDEVCTGVDVNGRCNVNADCIRSACVEGICKKLFVHSRCEYNTQCLSGNCMLYTPDRTYKTCARRSTGADCYRDDGCLSRKCRTFYLQCDCPSTYHACDGSLLGGQCREASDCKGSLNGTVTCNARICTPTDPAAPHPTSPGPPPTYTTGLGSAQMPFDYYAPGDDGVIDQILLT
ncbi:unnamed protein product [Tilletia laevis]|uniref:Dickkopf N-terminal cysteine-rich domain-containing protein n=3 Tax=Tilletia TaxID=13289 RepID=A0A9N8L6V8_9BASI|nr:hypothetical protein CF336_g5010 [Tilletia laevis]CAD6891333.1 unnamed protein product [Tilletia caries]CAD6915780.1 unnamed protein product [Tilletia controversa]KAE8198246.1 hypothetical protein CF335_g4426 [Tilletia laevis]CAD6896792.1 unnamed protein product [Tilletia laevis]